MFENEPARNMSDSSPVIAPKKALGIPGNPSLETRIGAGRPLSSVSQVDEAEEYSL